MSNSQATTLLFLALALVLFFFSLSLLPAVELYCRFRRPAIVLLILEVALLMFRFRVRGGISSASLVIGTYVFAILGVIFNTILLISAGGKCGSAWPTAP